MFFSYIGTAYGFDKKPDDFDSINDYIDALSKKIKEERTTLDKSKLYQGIDEGIAEWIAELKKRAEQEKEMEAMAKKSQNSASKKVDSSKQASYSSSKAVAMDKTIKALPKPPDPIDISQRLEAIRHLWK